MARQGNNYIMNDLNTYIDNIKDIVNDKSDKRLVLSANQYLLNRLYCNPINVLETDDSSHNDAGVLMNYLHN